MQTDATSSGPEGNKAHGIDYRGVVMIRPVRSFGRLLPERSRGVLRTVRSLTRAGLLLLLAATAAAGCGGSAVPSAAPGVVFWNVDGPAVSVSIGDVNLGLLKCGQRSTWDTGAPGAPRPPWHIQFVQADGSVFDAIDVPSADNAILVRRDGVLIGPPDGSVGPAPGPC